MTRAATTSTSSARTTGPREARPPARPRRRDARLAGGGAAAIANQRLVGDLRATLATDHQAIILRRMIPLRDVIPSRTTPFVTVAIIVVNVLAFLFEQSLGPRGLDESS